MKMKTGSAPKCLRLWHGTRGCEPSIIYSKDGFNVNYAQDGEGSWGDGIYFAENAVYSCSERFSFEVPGQENQYEVLFADVIIGLDCDLVGKTNKYLLEPPPIYGTNDRYDSVRGKRKGGDIYIVYKNVKTYPGLLVRYEL